MQQEIDVLKITMPRHAVRMGADRMHPAALTKVSVIDNVLLDVLNWEDFK